MSLRYCDLLIIDEMLPCDFSPFRTLEYRHYLNYFSSPVLLSTEGWHAWLSNLDFDEQLAQSELEESVKAKIERFSEFTSIVPKLAYITFLNNAWQVFPNLTERRIPFVLQLYPGGGFEPNVASSDEKLREIVHSPLCRKIIVTQRLSVDYLLEKIGCDPQKIKLIYGGVYDTRNGFDFTRDKKLFARDKDTLDICFVAHRYGDDTKKKGYDKFVAVAKALSAQFAAVRFHVVGDYTPDQIPLDRAADRITFHGKQSGSFFKEFYPRMDIILSVNRPSEIDAGAFDGFPTGACMEAGFRGVLNCVSDPLNLNVAFSDGQDIVLVDFDTDETVRKLSGLLSDPDKLYEMAYANWRKFLDVFDTDRQLWQRSRVILEQLLQPEALIVRPSPQMSLMDSKVLESVRENGRQALAVEKEVLRQLNVNLQDALTRHDNLAAAYATLAKGFESVRNENASLSARLATLTNELEAMRSSDAAKALQVLDAPSSHLRTAAPEQRKPDGDAPLGTLERAEFGVFRPGCAMSRRAGSSRASYRLWRLYQNRKVHK
ncbi:glycosyltransferase family 4 protein [Paraburkholderia sp. A1RI-2L]|uniref:glycosyltransferase family 4 protein n=1 Tax=Paraburkholderia sp. A1RI-2L TaxID=3028367 RepID=UPI003B81C67E